MIIIKNREMLIPNNERYIGTTYDSESEMRLFQIPRYSQRGVDLSALTFRLDLIYANNNTDVVVLSKEVTDQFIVVTWEITSSQLQVPGTLYIAIRAIDGEATVKWSSFTAAMYVERHLNAPGNYTGDLTEIEQMEQDHEYMKSVIDELRTHLDYRNDAEAWADGQRLGEDVPETDPAYHNNSKYYSELADDHRQTAEAYAKGTVNGIAAEEGETGYHDNSKYYSELAAASEQTATDTASAIVASRNQISTNATNIAAQTARIDNIVALTPGSTTGDAELQDIRVKANGTTSTTAGTAVREQITDLKSVLNDLAGHTYGTTSSNLFSTYTSDAYWKADGTQESSSYWAATSLIPVSGYNKITYANIGRAGTSSARCLWFDSSNAVLSDFAGSTDGETLDVPPNAAYVAFSIDKAHAIYSMFTITGYTIGTMQSQVNQIETDVDTALYEDVPVSIGSTTKGYWSVENNVASITASSTGSYFAIDALAVDNGYTYSVYINGRSTHTPVYLAQKTGNIYQVISEHPVSTNGWHIINVPVTADNCYLLMTKYGTLNPTVTKLNVPITVTLKAYTDDAIAHIEDNANSKRIAETGLTWDWWYTASAVDLYGTAYIGFIDENSKCGVMMRKADGAVAYKYLDEANNDDDHNPMGVCVDTNGYIYAFGTLGHSYANVIAIYKSTVPYTIDCEWTDLTVTLSQPTGATYKCTYSQAFVYNDGTTEYITDFFRVVSTDAGVCYAALQSTDGGATWTLHGVTGYSDPYIKCVDKGNGKIALVCTSNPIAGNRSIYIGEVDVTTGAISSDSAQVGTWSTIENGTDTGATQEIYASCAVNARNDFAVLLTASYRFRLLDAAYISNAIKVLWALSDEGFMDWTYYLFDGQESIPLGKSGIPFYLYSGYLPGACFAGDKIAVCRNVSDHQDGNHALYAYDIDGTNPIQKGAFNSLGCRPIPCGNGIVAVSIGVYNDTSTTEAGGTFTGWKLAPTFRNLV